MFDFIRRIFGGKQAAPEQRHSMPGRKPKARVPYKPRKRNPTPRRYYAKRTRAPIHTAVSMRTPWSEALKMPYHGGYLTRTRKDLDKKIRHPTGVTFDVASDREQGFAPTFQVPAHPGARKADVWR